MKLNNYSVQFFKDSTLAKYQYVTNKLLENFLSPRILQWCKAVGEESWVLLDIVS